MDDKWSKVLVFMLISIAGMEYRLSVGLLTNTCPPEANDVYIDCPENVCAELGHAAQFVCKITPSNAGIDWFLIQDDGDQQDVVARDADVVEPTMYSVNYVSEQHVSQLVIHNVTQDMAHAQIACKTGQVMSPAATIYIDAFDPETFQLELTVLGEDGEVLDLHALLSRRQMISVHVTTSETAPPVELFLYVNFKLVAHVAPSMDECTEPKAASLEHSLRVVNDGSHWLLITVTYIHPTLPMQKEVYATSRLFTVEDTGEFTLEPVDQCAVVGETLKFPCGVQVHETIDWHMEVPEGHIWVARNTHSNLPDIYEVDIKDTSEGRTSTLIIPEVTENMNGYGYFCEVLNHHASPMGMVNLARLNTETFERDTVVTLSGNNGTILPSQGAVSEGDYVTVEVSTPSAKPSSALMLYVNGQRVETVQPGAEEFTCREEKTTELKRLFEVEEGTETLIIKVMYTHLVLGEDEMELFSRTFTVIPKPGRSNHAAQSAAISLGAALGVVVLLVAIVCCLRFTQRQRRMKKHKEAWKQVHTDQEMCESCTPQMPKKHAVHS